MYENAFTKEIMIVNCKNILLFASEIMELNQKQLYDCETNKKANELK